MTRGITVLMLIFALWMPAAGLAQSRGETLADIRQQLSFLFVEIQNLRRELSTTGGFSSGGVTGDTTLQRLDSLESEFQRVTGKVEELEFRIGQIVADGTNRIGDLEFRLVELEGGDVSTLGETSTLGGETLASNSLPPITPPGTSGEVAVSEQVDYERAIDAFENGEFQSAANQLLDFTSAYPGGPLTGDAHFWRGESYAALDVWNKAARAFLESFSSSPQAGIAPRALFRLGVSLDRIGQTQEACLTLNEVLVRYPSDSAAEDADAEMRALACN